jgi:hypothetical protein
MESPNAGVRVSPCRSGRSGLREGGPCLRSPFREQVPCYDAKMSKNCSRLTPDQDGGDAALCSPPGPLAWREPGEHHPCLTSGGGQRVWRLGAGCVTPTLPTLVGTGDNSDDWL